MVLTLTQLCPSAGWEAAGHTLYLGELPLLPSKASPCRPTFFHCSLSCRMPPLLKVQVHCTLPWESVLGAPVSPPMPLVGFSRVPVVSDAVGSLICLPFLCLTTYPPSFPPPRCPLFFIPLHFLSLLPVSSPDLFFQPRVMYAGTYSSFTRRVYLRGGVYSRKNS